VLWIDEAGLLSTRTTAEVFDLAGRIGARVVLSGDRRQHGSVERGAALRLLEEEAGLVPSEVKEIQRQKGDYKRAVQALSEGRVTEGFETLDRLGWIRELEGDADRNQALAADYVATVAAGKTALVVSPTHREGARITEAIRAKLKETGKLHGQEREFDVLESANLTEAERADSANYSAGDVLVFHRNTKDHDRGERVAAGSEPLLLDHAARFQVYHTSHLTLSAGDTIRITKNGTTADGKHRLNNGATYTVNGFDDNGNLVLANGWTVGRNFGHLAYGYCATSHVSQGKTVDRVFIGQSAESLPASSMAQYYVSVSRGREQAIVYTDDKEALLEAVRRSDERLSATELVRDRTAVIRRTHEANRAADRAREPQRERDERVYG
jgi:ATP-dependent exoDNAse (exonuclease V) alpha subunit